MNRRNFMTRTALIYCEKPLALTVAEGRAMVSPARKYDRVFQTGNMQRSWRNFRHACEMVPNGYIGEVKVVNVSVGDPVIARDFGGGSITDWGEFNAVQFLGTEGKIEVSRSFYRSDIAGLTEKEPSGEDERSGQKTT